MRALEYYLSWNIPYLNHLDTTISNSEIHKQTYIHLENLAHVHGISNNFNKVTYRSN